MTLEKDCDLHAHGSIFMPYVLREKGKEVRKEGRREERKHGL